MTDKIIWLDGRTTTIPVEEADKNIKEVITDRGCEYILNYLDSEFIWMGNCWMEIQK